MKDRKMRYGVVKGYADGGKVELYKKPKMKPHVPAKIMDPIKSGEPGGPHTPGAKKKRAKKKKAASS